MPNNASARREKDKKKKDKKQKKDPKPLLKEDTASADSSTLSLSLTEKEEQDLSLALDRMEKAIQENANAAQEEGSDWAWARTALLVDYSQAATLEERLDKRRKFRKEIEKANPVVSKEELKSLLYCARLRSALEWRRNCLQSKKDSLLSSSLTEQKKEDEL